MTLRQTHGYVITFKKKGYESRSMKIKSEDSIEGDAGSFGQNLLAFGIGAPIGMIVDGISGADDRLFPGHANVTLKASNGGVVTQTSNVAQAITSVTKAD